MKSKLPRVTEILANAGLIDTRWFKPEHAERGTLVHAACQYDDWGETDQVPLAPELAGYLEAWRRFQRENAWECEAIEQPVSTAEYTGTLDRAGRLGPWRAILDIKTGAVGSWVRYQLVAYANAYQPGVMFRRVAVRLSADGHYQIKEFSVAEFIRDRQEWLRMVRQYGR